MLSTSQNQWIDAMGIEKMLAGAAEPSSRRVDELLAKARELRGLNCAEVAELIQVRAPNMLAEISAAAKGVKEHIYGRRIVMFAPLYVSNYCGNECSYCAFRVNNTAVRRKALSQEELDAEVRALLLQGHKRVLLVAGEGYPEGQGLDYILKAIDTVYAARAGAAAIHRVNVNLAPLSVDEFARLKERNIGTYQLFQETYHRPTYARHHLSGRKRDFDWRLSAFERAMEAGIDDVGAGVLFGLYDWKFEILALMGHIAALEDRFGVGPHTISVPRIEPAEGSSLSSRPPFAVSDEEFKRIVAIIRLAVPYTGIIMSTRESAQMRRETFALGVSQISAGSRTDPGGYTDSGESAGSQFSLGDHRTLGEVIADVAQLGHIPSFCTACYRLGRTGRDFMDLAKPGLIKRHCGPNALASFAEYLADYATPKARAVGQEAIDRELGAMDKLDAQTAHRLMEQVAKGGRDHFV